MLCLWSQDSARRRCPGGLHPSALPPAPALGLARTQKNRLGDTGVRGQVGVMGVRGQVGGHGGQRTGWGSWGSEDRLGGHRGQRTSWGSQGQDRLGITGVRGQVGHTCPLLRGCRVGWRGWMGGQPLATSLSICPGTSGTVFSAEHKADEDGQGSWPASACVQWASCRLLLKEQKTWVLRRPHSPLPPVILATVSQEDALSRPSEGSHPGLCVFLYSTHTSIRLEKPKPAPPSGYETPGGRGRVSAQGPGAQRGVPERAGQGALSPAAQQRPA